MCMFNTMVKKHKELENIQKFLRHKGFKESEIKEIAEEGHIQKNINKKSLKARVVIEIEINENIAELYNNFSINYEDGHDFLINQISYLEHNTSFDECEVFKNLHPAFGNPDYDYDLYDDGYKQIVKKVEFF